MNDWQKKIKIAKKLMKESKDDISTLPGTWVLSDIDPNTDSIDKFIVTQGNWSGCNEIELD